MSIYGQKAPLTFCLGLAHLHLHALNCAQLRSIALNRAQMRSNALEFAQMRSNALTCDQAPLKISLFPLEADFISVEYSRAVEMFFFSLQDSVRKVRAKSWNLYGIRERKWRPLRKFGISILRSQIFLKLAI